MIQPRSMLDVADNSGAKKVQCIRVMGGANKRYASLGDTVIVAIKEATPDGTVKKGEVATVYRNASLGGEVRPETLCAGKETRRSVGFRLLRSPLVCGAPPH